ncbi:hypothetical protein CVT26_005792 [Gymnopilus dilepis]|uniref:Uncharacterized protein n=1 Tax=Gymnopilus dilepis TaxID=231916 RepID=A0A409YL52_9AGAR|nr:hypothetical protein CVT26_005792 [Gymnopilus dilepis]
MVSALRTMRIIAIPLTRPTGRIQRLTNGHLTRYTYYQVQLPPKKLPPPLETEKGSEDAPPRQEKKGWLPEEGVVNWATQKAADIWAGFGKAKGGWKLKTYQVGEKLIDRIEFEELELKNFDTSLAPSLKQLKANPPPAKFPLLYPPSVLSHSATLSDLRSFLELRIPRHRKGFIMWLLISPFTAPFMLIPIIPNLPFFFCVWRSWSHYRAYKSSKYLQTLLEDDLIEPQASELLDQVYSTYRTPLLAPDAPVSTESEANPSEEPKLDFSSQAPKNLLLLTREAIPTLLSALDLQNDAKTSNDLHRAIDQTTSRLSIKS